MSPDDLLRWLQDLLRRFGIRRLPLRPRAWQTGCLTSGTFTPPSDIPVPIPPPVDWTWIPALWEEFWPGGGGGKPPNLGPVSWTDPSAKHVDRSHPGAANNPNGGG